MFQVLSYLWEWNFGSNIINVTRSAGNFYKNGPFLMKNFSQDFKFLVTFFPLSPLRRQGGSKVMDHQNWFYDVFWKRRVRGTSCFLPHQKILILAKVMAGWRSALMSNSIVRANFIRDYLKILFFELQNVSPPTFF